MAEACLPRSPFRAGVHALVGAKTRSFTEAVPIGPGLFGFLAVTLELPETTACCAPTKTWGAPTLGKPREIR